jgi:hypothetical protein
VQFTTDRGDTMTGICKQMNGTMEAIPERGNRGHRKPPSEAFEACTGKTEGDHVQIITPRGDKIKGICKQFNDGLAAMPERGAMPPLPPNPPEMP